MECQKCHEAIEEGWWLFVLGLMVRSTVVPKLAGKWYGVRCRLMI